MDSPCAVSLRSTWMLFLFGCVISLPVDKGFGSNNPSPEWSDYHSPGSAYPVGQDASVSACGRAPQHHNAEAPSTCSQHNGDSNADSGVHSNDGSNMDAGDSGWAKNGGMDSGSDDAYYPVPEGYPEKHYTSMDEETPEEDTEEEEPVLSDVSDLEPVYHFSSRSRYQQGRQAFFLTRYNPGEPTVGSADMSDSTNGMGNGKGWPVAGESGKGGY
ncbi:uncharacterized protein LOC115538318 [Gadus morhua]|uniref:uncharacterized protein LOC115538318 n=1 Tax=Gadus morhua TaxID=8049 RepID=UPI0011B5A88C|nr:uncharacterized protein LOC115538318 [Gadus morhua]